MLTTPRAPALAEAFQLPPTIDNLRRAKLADRRANRALRAIALALGATLL